PTGPPRWPFCRRTYPPARDRANPPRASHPEGRLRPLEVAGRPLPELQAQPNVPAGVGIVHAAGTLEQSETLRQILRHPVALGETKAELPTGHPFAAVTPFSKQTQRLRL